jgi:UDP-N-acetylglucosamine 4-epimerase
MTSLNISGKSFLITGGAGFIGSHIAEYLLAQDAKVRVLDNLATGSMENIKPLLTNSSFEFVEGDIRDIDTCKKSCAGVDFISHQAALGSVPRSIKDPVTTHEVNSTGFVNMAIAAKESGIRRFIYASTSSIYGDSKLLPKREDETGNALSPYAVSKKTNELYARVFGDAYEMEFIGLRYFNVFGPRQSPAGPYAAVIPLFIRAALNKETAHIDGDGNQTRDFSYVENVVQANVKAMLTVNNEAVNKVYNVAVGERISVNELHTLIAAITGSGLSPVYRETRAGDVRDSLADISLAKKHLSYEPTVKAMEGLEKTVEWFRNKK